MPAGLGGVLAKRASREVKMEVRANKFYMYNKMKLPNFVSTSGDSSSKSANFGLSKWIFYVKNRPSPNLFDFFFHWRIIVYGHIFCKNDLLITSIFEPLYF